MLYVKLFGAPSLAWDGEPFDLSRRQARALLFRLAADAAPVARGQLAFLLWPDLSDRKARQNLTRLLSFIRGALPDPELLLVGRDQIGLDADRCVCDSRRFEELLHPGDAAGLAQAVDQYLGQFLSGFDLSGAPEYENWLVGEQNRYERRYLEALDALVALRESAADFEAAIAYARRYLAADELSEDMHRRLIVLYGRSGDRAAAQRQYETCLTVLERELGVSPLPETQAAYQAALADESSSTRAAATVARVEPHWNVLPSLDLPLIGRDQAWSQLERAFASFASGGFIFISGEPGIGKSRLLQEFAAAQGDRLVLTGNCYPGSRDLPYQPIVQALRLALAHRDLWSDIRSIWLAETRAILPELAGSFPDLPDPLQVDPAQAQARIFEALSQVVLHLAARQPLLLCLDDLHWADEATLEWLAYLAGRLSGSKLCIMATFRSQEAPPLGGLRQTLRRAGLQAEISLSGLSVGAISAILDQLPAPNARPLATSISRATAGNAYFVLETIRTLIEQDQLANPPDQLPLPTTVQEAIRGRLERLDPLANQVIEAAAVLQPDLSLALLERAAGRSEEELVDGLDQLVTRQMLRANERGFVFQHELLRMVVYDGLNVWRRRMLHRRAAVALAELSQAGVRETVARIAAHYEAAGEVGPAVSYYGQAARLAQQQHAYHEAGELALQALNFTSGVDHDPAVLRDLQELLADSRLATGQFTEASAIYCQILESLPAAREAMPKQPWRRAEVQRKLAFALKPLQRYEEADELYELASAFLRPLVDSWPESRRIWLHCQLDRLDLYYLQARVDEMANLVSAVEPLARELNDPYYLSLFYAAVTWHRFHQERFRFSSETVAIGQERLANALATGDPRDIADQQFGLGFILLWAGRLAEASEPLQDALSKAEELDHAFLQVRCLAYLSILHRLLGDPALVKRYLAQSEGLDYEDKYRSYIGVEHALRAWLAYLEGDWTTAHEQSLAALVAWEDALYPFHWLADWILLAHGLSLGDLDQAARAAAEMLHPRQQQLPEEITASLEEVVRVYEIGDGKASQAAMARVLRLAKDHGYL